MGLVVVQSYLLSVLDDLEMPYGKPNARAYVTPPDPNVKAKIPAIYIWPADGEKNRSPQLGGTIPRNTGPGTSAGTKGALHEMDVYLTWFSTGTGKSQDPVFPGMIDVMCYALEFSAPNPVTMTDPNTQVVSDVYNVGEVLRYSTGIESTADEREKRYDCLLKCSVWEIYHCLFVFPTCIFLTHTTVAADFILRSPSGNWQPGFGHGSIIADFLSYGEIN